MSTIYDQFTILMGSHFESSNGRILHSPSYHAKNISLHIGELFVNARGDFDNLAIHYTHTVCVMFILTSIGCTCATQQDVTALWTSILYLRS